jgi:hypothetical protein
VLGLLLITLATFSQTIILNKGGDTLTCLSQPQVKFLLKEHYGKIMYKSLDSICEAQRSISDSLITSKNKDIQSQSMIIINQKEIISLRDHETIDLKLSLASEQKRVRIQKVYKWIAIGAGGALSGYLGFKYITK